MENETKQIETKTEAEKPQEEIPVTVSPLEEARQLNDSIKRHNEELKLLLDRQERIAAEARLEGKGFAGQNQKPREPTLNDKAREFFKGSEIEKALAKYGEHI